MDMLMNLVNNQLDAQFFVYVYFYSLHVSGSHVPIIRRIIVSVRHLVCVSLCRLPSGMQEHFSCMFISILYMFRAAMCPSSGELLYQRDTCFVSLCVDDRLVCRSICSCVFISILYMFRAAMCPSSGELLYQCDTWFMSLNVDDHLVCRLTACQTVIHTE